MNRFLEKVAEMQVDKEKVRRYLNKNYPADTLNWVKSAEWVEKEVPLSQIKMARRPGGPREQEKVAGIAQAFKDNKKMEPVVLVRNADGELKIADGYHRTLGCQKSGKGTIKAWVGTTGEKNGPWDKEMHERKLNVGKTAFETFEEFEKEAALLGGIARLGGKMIKSTGKELKNFGSGITGMGARKAKNNLTNLKASGTASRADLSGAKKDLRGERWNQTKAWGLTGLGAAGVGANKAMEVAEADQFKVDPAEQFNQNRHFQKMASSLIEATEQFVPEKIKQNQLLQQADQGRQELAQHNLRALGAIGMAQKLYENGIKKEN